MLFKQYILSGLFTSGAVKAFQCNTPDLSKNDKHTLRSQLEAARPFNANLASTVKIDTYMHVLASSKELHDGYATRESLVNRINVLNQEFKKANFQFTLQDIEWKVTNNTSEGVMSGLRKGGYSTLNLYFITGDDGGACTVPDNNGASGNRVKTDFCIISANLVPGGSDGDDNLGFTTVHEVGHWLGLLHPFGDNCDEDADHVDDTPIEKEAAWGCPFGRDSCPDQPGLDAIRNHMDYTTDSCKTPGEGFTAGQIVRMKDTWVAFRKGN